jgi:hypothetical protein
MISIRRLQSSFLGILLLCLPCCLTNTFPNMHKAVAFLKHQSHKCALHLGLVRQPIGIFKLFHDIEDDLGYILQVDSLRELTDNLVVYANGRRLVSDEITPIVFCDTTCNFIFEFPLAAFLKLLQEEKMRTLVTTYKEQIEEYIKNTTHSYIKYLYEKYKGTSLFQAFLRLIQVRVHFSYTITKEDLEKECVSLLALMLRKRVELRNWSAKSSEDAVLFSTGYSPLRTINIHIVP